MVLFEDRDEDGVITTESMSTDPALVEVLQRNFYYAFGLPMQGPWNHAPADPDMPNLYNGKELEGGWGGWTTAPATTTRLLGVGVGWIRWRICTMDGRRTTTCWRTRFRLWIQMGGVWRGGVLILQGDVLYDDGIDDGNIYYLGDYSGKKLTSQSEADDAKVELQAAATNFTLEDQVLFENVVRSMLGGLSPMVGEINAATSSAYNMRLLRLNPAPKTKMVI